MNEYIHEEIDPDTGRFVCLVPILNDLQDGDPGNIEKALKLLETSQRFTPRNAYTRYLIGQALCLEGSFETAIENLDTFIDERSYNPLGWMERGFAYFSWAESLEQAQASLKSSYMNAAILSLEQVGITGSMLRNHGDTVFEEGDYRTAWVYYHLSNTFKLASDEHRFRIGVLDLVMTGDTDQSEFINDGLIQILEDSLIIQPSEFFRMEDGAPVFTQDAQGEAAGMYYRYKDPGGVLFWVEESGGYNLTVNALDHPPAATEIQISLDFDPLFLIELPNGDDSWLSFTEKITLDRGYHLLHVRLTNDDKVEGVDRNAYIGECELTLCE